MSRICVNMNHEHYRKKPENFIGEGIPNDSDDETINSSQT